MNYINNQLLLSSEKNTIGELYNYNGILSVNFAYTRQNMIIPKNAHLTELSITKKKKNNDTPTYCYFCLIDVYTNEIKQKFIATNFTVNETDGSYKQEIPINLYNETDCYLATLLTSYTNYYPASIYPTTKTNASFSWEYYSSSETISEKKSYAL